jgi:hypothetical protein
VFESIKDGLIVVFSGPGFLTAATQTYYIYQIFLLPVRKSLGGGGMIRG